MSLQAYRWFCNLFIITCNTRVHVSKKSTALSIPFDIREDKRLMIVCYSLDIQKTSNDIRT